MKTSIIICDDLAEDRMRLQAAVQEYGRRRGYQIEVQTSASGEELLDRWSPDRWDLVLLDIFMDGLSGVEAARRLRERDDRCEIVFVTNSQAHGVVSYDLRVLDYLVKPVSQEKVADTLDWFVQVRWERLRTLEVFSEWEEIQILLRDVCFIEVQQHSVLIHVGKKVVRARRGIAELEREIESPNFFRCHRSYLVNLAHVRGIEKNDLLMDNGQRVPVSLPNRQPLKQRLMEWTLEKNWVRDREELRKKRLALR